jgi:hypothetical protein
MTAIERARSLPRRLGRYVPRSQNQFEYLLKRLWIRVRVVMRLVAKEAEWKVPFRQRHPRWWRHGFLSRSAIVYDLERNDPSLYVSDVQRYLRTRHMVHPRLQDIINNKLSTHLLLQNLAIPTPRLAGVYSRGSVHLYPTETRLETIDFLVQLPVGERLFFKPLGGAEGKNLYSVRRTSEGLRVNGREVSLDEGCQSITRANRPLIIEGLVEQHAQQSDLFPETTNTLRLLTMLDLASKEPFILIAVQRIGSVASGLVDNWTQGGLSARVDLDSGRLGPAARLPQQESRLQWLATHPDTGTAIEGQVVPFWAETIEVVLRAAKAISFLEYVGWDIIVGPDGPVVLEANINSGMNVLQVHQPLLADPRAQAYLSSRRVLR